MPFKPCWTALIVRSCIRAFFERDFSAAVQFPSGLKSFGGGGVKPAEDFSKSPGRCRRPSRYLPVLPAWLAALASGLQPRFTGAATVFLASFQSPGRVKNRLSVVTSIFSVGAFVSFQCPNQNSFANIGFFHGHRFAQIERRRELWRFSKMKCPCFKKCRE